MTVLYTQVTLQIDKDVSRSTNIAVLTYVATNLYVQPSYQGLYDIGGANDALATPFPIFTDDDVGRAAARVYFDPIAADMLIPLANARDLLTIYTTLDIESVLAPVKADFSALAAVASTGSYTDLTNTPVIPAAQVNADWNATTGVTEINNKPSLAAVATTGAYADLSGKPSVPTVWAYEGIAQRLGAFPIFKSATVASGVAVFNLTNDGTSTGAALFPGGVIADSLNLLVSDAAASYQMSGAWSNGNKTLTVTANKLTTANILSGLLGQTAANGAVVKMSVWVY